jgi:sedoheptulokinase
MMPPSLLEGRGRIVASGNALRRNPLLAEAAREVFGKPLEFSSSPEEAACGAAILASRRRG